MARARCDHATRHLSPRLWQKADRTGAPLHAASKDGVHLWCKRGVVPDRAAAAVDRNGAFGHQGSRAGMMRVGALQGLQVLIVEDDFLVADTLVDTLQEAGANVLGPLGRLDETLAFVRRHGAELGGVVLDLNLHGQPTYPIADALIEAGVQFVFVTGYDATALDAAYRDYPRCEKPIQSQAIVAAL